MTPKTWRLFERVLSGSPCWSPQPCGCSLESGVYPPVIRSVMNWSMGISGSLYRLYIWPLNWCNFRKAQIKPIHSERSWGKGMSIANPVRWGPGYPVCFGPFWRCLARTRWRNDDFDFRSSWLTDASSKCGSPKWQKYKPQRSNLLQSRGLEGSGPKSAGTSFLDTCHCRWTCPGFQGEDNKGISGCFGDPRGGPHHSNFGTTKAISDCRRLCTLVLWRWFHRSLGPSGSWRGPMLHHWSASPDQECARDQGDKARICSCTGRWILCNMGCSILGWWQLTSHRSAQERATDSGEQ